MTDRLTQLLKLREADPQDADLPYMIALEYAKADDAGLAVEYFDQALALNPHYHYAYFQKAKLLDSEGESEQALETIEQGIAMATKAGDGKALGELQELRSVMKG